MHFGKRPSNFKDLTGKTFGRLTVIKEGAPRGCRKRITWDCVCECGTKKEVVSDALTTGKTLSCGCWRIEAASIARSVSHRTHGASMTRTYRTWRAMKERCQNKHSKYYPDYGGRGITVSAAWKKFENFVADMGEAPDGMSLDRIDNDKGYSKENCRWATRVQQQRNRRISFEPWMYDVIDEMKARGYSDNGARNVAKRLRDGKPPGQRKSGLIGSKKERMIK